MHVRGSFKVSQGSGDLLPVDEHNTHLPDKTEFGKKECGII